MIANSASFLPHDVAALLASVTFPAANGAAWYKMACNPQYKYSVTKDLNAVFKGVGTLTHELAHK